MYHLPSSQCYYHWVDTSDGGRKYTAFLNINTKRKYTAFLNINTKRKYTAFLNINTKRKYTAFLNINTKRKMLLMKIDKQCITYFNYVCFMFIVLMTSFHKLKDKHLQ